MAVRYNPKIVSDDLTFVVDAANVKSYPGSGTTWFDVSGRQNNGTFVNSGNITYANGPARLKLNEGDTAGTGYINMGTVVESGDKYTKNIWFRTNAAGSNNLMSAGASAGAVLWCQGTQRYISAGHNSSWYQVQYDAGGTSLQNWHNACVTYASTTLKLYVNGELKSTGSSTNITNLDLRIGGFGTQYELTGDVAYASLYNRALTDAEVLENYNALKSRFGL